MIHNIKYELSALRADFSDRINKIYMIFLVFLYPDYPVYPVKKKKSLYYKFTKNKKGFTLIEIIIVIIVLSVLSVFGFHFISTSIHTYSMMEKQKGLFDQATMVMERISRELRDAESITTATGSILEFTKSHGTDEDSDTAIKFQLSDTTLTRKRGTNDPENLADNVTAFTVTNSSNEITISLTLESGEANITLRSYIYPKNLAYPDPVSGRNFGGDWEEDYQ